MPPDTVNAPPLMKLFTSRPPVAACRAWEAAVVLVSVLFIGLYMWPVSVAPGRWVWGGFGDALGNAFLFTWIDQAFHMGQPLPLNRNIAIPFGEDLGSLPHEPVFFAVELLVGRLFGAVAALNLITFAGGPLATWTMYRLLIFLNRSGPAAFCGGIAYGCSSFVLHNTYGEPTLVQIWIFPLAAWALLSALTRPRPLSVAVAAGAVALSATVNFYFSLFAALMCLTLVGGWLGLATLQHRRLPTWSLLAAAVAGASGAMIAGVLFVVTVGNLQRPAQNIQRPVANLQSLAPDPLDVILPTGWNPWMGAPGREHYLARLARTGEFFDLSEMSIPSPVLLLAPIGALLLLAGRPALARQRRLEIAALLLVGVLGAWLTVPPNVVPSHLRRLSLQFDLHRLFPQYEHFSRAIVLVELGSIPLAAVALAALLRGRSRVAVPVALILVAATLAETYERVPNAMLEVVPPPQNAWLAAHPGQYAVADFPMIPPDSGGNEHTFLFYQRFDGHPRVNGDIPGTESQSMREELSDPNRQGVPERLAALGVRYVTWFPNVLSQYAPLNPHQAAIFRANQPRPPGYRLEASFTDGGAVYSVQAPAATEFAFYGSGFGPVFTGPDGRPVRQRQPDRATTLDVYARVPASVELHFDCSGGPGVITLNRSGNSIGSWSANGISTSVSALLSVPAGITRLHMAWRSDPASTAAPGPTCSLITVS